MDTYHCEWKSTVANQLLWTVVTQNGDLTASVQSLVEVEYKQEPELAPIPHLPTEERTAVAWDPVHLPENATMMHAIMKLGPPRDVTTTQEKPWAIF